MILETVLQSDKKVNNLEDLIFAKEVGKRIITTIHRTISKGQIRSKLKLREEEMEEFEINYAGFKKTYDEKICAPRNDTIHEIGELIVLTICKHSK